MLILASNRVREAKIINIFLIAATFLLLLPACTHGPKWTTEAYAAEVEQWKNKDVRSLIAKHGYPDKTFKSPDGNEVYEYFTAKFYRTPESFHTHLHPYGGSATTYRVGGDVVSAKCRTWFEISEQKIIKITFRGELCKAPELDKPTKGD